MITVRPDLDALGAMALIEYRSSEGEITPEIAERIEEIAIADKFARGGWPGKTELPSSENPWPKSANASDNHKLAAIGSRVMDFKALIAGRVDSMKEFLVSGTEPAEYRNKVEQEQADMISALERGDIKIEIEADGQIAYVESSHRSGTTLGYTQAPVVIAFNPTFKQGPGDPYKKFTICQYDGTWIDLTALKAELATIEEGWGGSPTIIGSPQGHDSIIDPKKIIEIATKHLKPRK